MAGSGAAVGSWRRGRAYGQDLRDRVLACPDLTLVQVAARFGVSPSYVSKARARLRELGDASAGRQCNHVPLRLAPLLGDIRARVEAEPDARLRELRSWLLDAHGTRVSQPVLWKVLDRMGLTLEKSTSGPRSRTART